MAPSALTICLGLAALVAQANAQTPAPTSAPTSQPTSAPTSGSTGSTAAPATSAPATSAAPVTTAAPAAPVTTAAPTEVVTLELVVENVDFTALSADATLLAAFTASVKTSVATSAGVNETDVAITLTESSVKVVADITPPAGTTAASMKTTLEASTTIGSSLVTALGSVSGLAAVTSGDLAVSSISLSAVATGGNSNATTTAAAGATASGAVETVTFKMTGFVTMCVALGFALGA